MLKHNCCFLLQFMKEQDLTCIILCLVATTIATSSFVSAKLLLYSNNTEKDDDITGIYVIAINLMIM